jgi:hypothetical protein
MQGNHNPDPVDEIAASEAQTSVLNYLGTDWNIYKACRAAGVSRVTLYRDWLSNVDFLNRFNDIRDQWLDGAESNLLEQGVNNKRNFVPAIFMLKSHRPEIYDRQALAGRMLGNVTINIGQVSSDTLKGLDLTGKARITVDDVPTIDSGKDSTA